MHHLLHTDLIDLVRFRVICFRHDRSHRKGILGWDDQTLCHAACLAGVLLPSDLRGEAPFDILEAVVYHLLLRVSGVRPWMMGCRGENGCLVDHERLLGLPMHCGSCQV